VLEGGGSIDGREWPIRRRLASRYAAENGLWPTITGERRSMVTPSARSAFTLSGLLVISGGGAVVARVVGEAEDAVGVDRVVAGRLECVRADLVRQADAAALLAQVEDDALPAPRDLGLRGLELVAAVALEGAEDLAGEALRVHARQDAALVPDVAHDEGHDLLRYLTSL
jgi:hypothetical protein